MKLLELLAKLGILRYGAKTATWTSAKDMPSEFLMDGVFDGQRDLTNRDDLKQIAGEGTPATAHFCTQCGSAVQPGAHFCTQCGSKIS